jgi:hypothetical protein
MPKQERPLLGPGAPDFDGLLERLMRIKSPETLEQAERRLADELRERAGRGQYALNALNAVKGSPRQAASLGHAMMIEAERVDRPELGDEGRCWLLLAALGGDEQSRRYIDETMRNDPKSPGGGRSPASGGHLPRVFRPTGADTLPADLEAALRADPAIEEDETEAVPDSDARPGRVVLREIGDPKSKDGLELQRRFRHVAGTRLPYAGDVPMPGEMLASLSAEWPWAEDALRFIEGRMALMRHARSRFVRMPPLLLVGPTGSGKTTIAVALARILGLPFNVVSCGGVADSGGLAPTTRGWTTNRPSAPFMAMAQSGAANPLVVLDELDKGTPARSQNGSVWAAALSMLEQPDIYFDSCLMAQVDLSAITFVATANDAGVLPPELLDRFQIVQVPRPRPKDFLTVLRGALEAEARSLQTDVDLLPPLDRDDTAFLRDMFSQKRNSLRSFRKIAALMLAEKAQSSEASPRMLN